jgi:hypothetical protein
MNRRPVTLPGVARLLSFSMSDCQFRRADDLSHIRRYRLNVPTDVHGNAGTGVVVDSVVVKR